MMRFRKIRRDENGAAVIEFAIAVPVLLTMIFGIFQFGLVFFASAGIQHALGEGARQATLFPTPSDSAIQTTMQNNVFGVYIGSINTPSVTIPATTECTNCRLLSITYTVTPNYIFVAGSPITITRSKRVYLAV